MKIDWKEIRTCIVTTPKEILWLMFWIGLFFNPFIFLVSLVLFYFNEAKE